MNNVASYTARLELTVIRGDSMLIKNIELSDRLDSDGDLEVIVTALGVDESMWIDKDEALAIIAHLQSKFELGV